jgi:SAM-dependent methyltransferase
MRMLKASRHTAWPGEIACLRQRIGCAKVGKPKTQTMPARTAAMQNDTSPNHAFVLAQAAQELAGANGPILDYGCGTGYFVGRARAAGFDAWGCDTFADTWAEWRTGLAPEVTPYIAHLTAERLPYPDGHFAMIISNMVFEHIPFATLQAVMPELHRILRPGGTMLTMFPTRETWFEGHLGLYFPHRLGRFPRLQNRYLQTAHRTGIGYYRAGFTSQQWADYQQNVMRTAVFYHHWRDVRALLMATFQAEPTDHALEFMAHRIAGSKRFRGALPFVRRWPVSHALRKICQRRAGQICLVRKASA